MAERYTERGFEIEQELDRAEREHKLRRFMAEAIAYFEYRIENIDKYPRERFTFFDVD